LGREVAAGVAVGQHDGAPAGHDAVEPGQAQHAVAEHDTRQVVVVEDERPLPPARADDDLPRPHLEEALPPERPEQVALVQAERRRPRQHADVRVAGHGRAQLLHRARCRAGVEDVAAELGHALQEQHAGAGLGRAPRRRQARRAAADHAHLGMQVLHLGRGFRPGVDVDAADAGDVAHRVLEDRPQPGGAVKVLVVEADRQEAVEVVEGAEDVAVQRRPGVLVDDDLAVAGGLGAGANVGPAVDMHEAVGTVAGDAEEAARPVVLEAAAEDADAGRVQRRGDALAGTGGDGAVAEGERQRPGGVGHARPSRSQAVRCTSLVRTSRSTSSQRRQPKR
jgi:hypothetical protein